MTILTVHNYIDLKCLLCLCVTVKIQFDNTGTYEYSSYSPFAQSLWAPPYSEILDLPLDRHLGIHF